jgi:hypothetical protein
VELFGFQISKAVKDTSDEEKPNQVSFIPKEDDGATVVSSAGAYGQYVDLDGSIQTDSELITRYRTMAEHPSLATAITSIVNEAIINEPEDDTVAIDLDKVETIPDGTKEKIEDEFKNILRLYNFDLEGYEIFKRWYVDGRLFYHAIIDSNNTKDGIKELRYIDPRKIRKVREVVKKPMTGRVGGNAGPEAGDQVQQQREFYIFNDKGFTREDLSAIQQGGGVSTGLLKISKDAIVHITSGQMDSRGKSVVSFLHKAIRPLNVLTMIEDSSVIYRISRAPEKRIFYIDTSGMSRAKGEQYMKQTITNFKNKIVFDSATGQVKDQRKFSTMFEDFYLARRDGGKGTEITTLPPGQNLDQIEDIVYFQKRLYQALEVPTSRLDPEQMFTLGRVGEITRDEVAFEKFITRLRARFSTILLNTLRLQLLLKNIITGDDWEKMKNDIAFVYAKDSVWAELKDNEVMNGRIAVAMGMVPFIGRYFSEEYVRKNVFKQTEEMQKEEDKKIQGEKGMEQYAQPIGMQTDPNAIDPGMDDLTQSSGQTLANRQQIDK